MQRDKNAKLLAWLTTTTKKKKTSIKSTGRLFLAAPGLCQGTDFSPSSVSSLCVLLFPFCLSSFFLLLTEPSLSEKQSAGSQRCLPSAGPGNRWGCLPVDWDTGLLRCSRETPLLSEVGSCGGHTQNSQNCCFFYHLPCYFIPISFFPWMSL